MRTVQLLKLRTGPHEHKRGTPKLRLGGRRELLGRSSASRASPGFAPEATRYGATGKAKVQLAVSGCLRACWDQDLDGVVPQGDRDLAFSRFVLLAVVVVRIGLPGVVVHVQLGR